MRKTHAPPKITAYDQPIPLSVLDNNGELHIGFLFNSPPHSQTHLEHLKHLGIVHLVFEGSIHHFPLLEQLCSGGLRYVGGREKDTGGGESDT